MRAGADTTTRTPDDERRGSTTACLRTYRSTADPSTTTRSSNGCGPLDSPHSGPGTRTPRAKPVIARDVSLSADSVPDAAGMSFRFLVSTEVELQSLINHRLRDELLTVGGVRRG